MRVRVLTSGAQGDVRPAVALSAGLRAAGHDVRVVSHPGFERLVRSRGLEFAPIAGDPRTLVAAENQQLRDLHTGGRNLATWWRALRDVEVPLMRQRLGECWEACQDAEVIVTSVLPYLFAYAVARRLDVPLVRGFYFPVSPTRDTPVDFVPEWVRLGGRFNLATYTVQRQLLWTVARPWIAGACRAVLGDARLPYREPFGDLDRQRQLLLYAYSEALAPRPPDWGDWIDVTGYWWLDHPSDWTPPPALAEFLASGPPPVCVGFGSMSFDRDAMVGIVTRALADAGQRGVLLTGAGGLRPPQLSKNLITVDWAPLDWLFPRMSVVVHHGGAGTTADGLRAGVPTVVVPFFYDQFFWGKRVFLSGAGPRPIPQKQLDAASLATAIRLAATDPHMRQRARAIGERLRAEDGVGRAVTAFDRHLGRPRAAAPAGQPQAVSPRP